MSETGKINQRIEETILVIVILMQIFDFFGLLPGDIDYAKKIISWSALGYIVYKIDLMRIMFGRRKKSGLLNNRALNLLIIISYFLLITKNLTSYSRVAEGMHYFKPFLFFIAKNSIIIEYWSFYIGGAILLILAVYLAATSKIRKPSLIYVVYGKGDKLKGKFIARFFWISVILVSFFVVVFNLMMEWLAISVDAPLVMIALLFYLFVIMRHYKRLSAETLVYKIGKVGDEFYKKFVRLFQYKGTFFLGLSAMLALHLLTDIGNFILPYIIGRQDALYFGSFDIGTHRSLAYLFSRDFSFADSFLSQLSLIWAYIFNILAILFLLAIPSYIWYKLYRKKGFRVSRFGLGIFFISVFVFFISPVFSISPILKEELLTSSEIVGVDFETKGVLDSPFLVAFVISFVIGVAAYFLSYSHFFKEKMIIAGIVIIDSFFALYIYYFFTSSLRYYVDTIRFLLENSQFFIVGYMLLFFAATILFYILGFFAFIQETKKEFRYMK